MCREAPRRAASPEGEFDNARARVQFAAAIRAAIGGGKDAAGLRRAQRRAAAPLAPWRPRRPPLPRRRRRGPPRPAPRPRRRPRGGFFAVYVPGNLAPLAALVGDEDDGSVVDLPHMGPVDASDARRVTLEQAGILLRMARDRPAPSGCAGRRRDRGGRGGGRHGRDLPPRGRRGDRARPRRARGAPRRRAALARAGLVAPERLRRRHPLPLPRRPRRGPGPDPRRPGLVRACNRLGILFDLSHLNAAGFRDAAALSDKPLVATHSNAHALAPAAQPDRRPARRDRRAAGSSASTTPSASCATTAARSPTPGSPTMVRHLDHLLARLGEDGVALGSDFDGALMPREIGDVAGFPRSSAPCARPATARRWSRRSAGATGSASSGAPSPPDAAGAPNSRRGSPSRSRR